MDIREESYSIYVFSLFSHFQSKFFGLHLFCPCRMFMHSNWWRHLLRFAGRFPSIFFYNWFCWKHWTTFRGRAVRDGV